MVSVIVPVYNTAKYVEKTVDSIINQTYIDWEMLLIDDGSTDNSGTICDMIAAANDKIRVYHQNNKGLSAVRNVGIKLSRGKYLIFVDSDDEVCRTFLENMVKEIEEKQADIVFCGLRRINGTRVIEQFYERKVYNKDGYYIATYDETKFKTKSSCTAIYKKSIINQNKVLFPEMLLCGEDSIFVQRYISCCKNAIVTTDTCYYDYINQNANSITKNIFFNHYILEFELYKKSFRDTINKENFIKNTGNRYVDIMIRELMCYVAYSNESLRIKLSHMNGILKDTLFQQAMRYYKVTSSAHSKWIPFFMRKRLTLMTYYAFKYRIVAKKYKKNHAPFIHIKSIWREIINKESLVGN